MYPSPLHYRIVPELIYQTGAPPVHRYVPVRLCAARHAYDFRTLRLVIAGAEAVKDRTRQVYMERYGIPRPRRLRRHETAPVLAMNTPMPIVRAASAGCSPLMEAPPRSGPRHREGGRLSVRGPTSCWDICERKIPACWAAVGGWHDTRRYRHHRCGRASSRSRAAPNRFAKIAGEMVSLSAVEAMASALWPQAMSVAVSIPEARKGERIVLLTTQKDAERSAMQRHAKTAGASELAVPADIRVVGNVPLLGSGKTDYVGATSLPLELATPLSRRRNSKPLNSKPPNSSRITLPPRRGEPDHAVRQTALVRSPRNRAPIRPRFSAPRSDSAKMV